MGNLMGQGRQAEATSPSKSSNEVHVKASPVPPSQRQWFKKYRHGDPHNTETSEAKFLAKEFMEELPTSTHPVPPAGLWAIPTYTPYVHDALTEEMVQRAEKQLGVKLPSLLIEIFKQQHGGYLRRSTGSTFSYFYGMSDSSDKPSMLHVEIWQRFHELQERIDRGENVDDWDLEWPPEQWNLLVPIAGDGCHYFFCLDYRRCGPTGEPRITHVDIELESDVEVAMSLKAWLQHGEIDDLRYEEGDAVRKILVKLRGADLESVMVELLRLVEQGGGGPWGKTPDTVKTIPPALRSHCGAAEYVACTSKGADGGVLVATSALCFKEQTPDAGRGTVFSGALAHSFPEHPDATHAIAGDASILARVLEVLPAMHSAELVFPAPAARTAPAAPGT